MASHASKLWVLLLGLGIAAILLAAQKPKKTIREDSGASSIEKLLLLPPPPPAPPEISFAVSDVISGETKHCESPTNPAAHDRIPGGACSGAAVAVATNAVDFALEKQWRKAIGLYSEAIKLCDSNGTYYNNRAAAYLEIGSSLQAEEDCTKAITLDKKNAKAYLLRGTAREMLGVYKEAMDDFRHALVLEPNNKRASLSAERLRKVFQ
ncbi:Tetratricopeptide repeat-containing protein [Hirschfeldia incana]|nr:Tetratricopeptide repeat-containing protein [Hirschfeldia incana]